ncbi:hypothetical protein EDB19DRAFT_1363210 [Suillus lakei]|nr:hypothetical protein EDB19DRAFT_1363210 [Suillus lakei]
MHSFPITLTTDLLHWLMLTPRPAPKTKGARRIPPGFFADALRDADIRDFHLWLNALTNVLSVAYSQSNRPNNRPAPARTLSRISSSWHRSKPHRTTEHDTHPRSHPLSWTQNLISGIPRRRPESDIELQEPPVVDVPCTAGQPRNYHARKKPAASTSKPSNTHTAQQPSGAAQSTPSASQQPPPTAAASTSSTVAGAAGITGTISRPHIIGAGWRARFVGWLCCMSIQTTGGQH